MEKSRSLVERARLEIVYTPKGYRGFESLLLRQGLITLLCNKSFFFLRSLWSPVLFGCNKLAADIHALTEAVFRCCKPLLRLGLFTLLVRQQT